MMTEREGMWNGRSFVNVTLGCMTYVLQPSCRKTTHTPTSVEHAAKGSPSSRNTQKTLKLCVKFLPSDLYIIQHHENLALCF